jgi:hypothetical protein
MFAMLPSRLECTGDITNSCASCRTTICGDPRPPPLQRVNGRLAMLGFVSILGPELSKKQPVLEQLGDAWFGVLFFSLVGSTAATCGLAARERVR